MAAPILATKLYIPPPRSKIVLRPRLIERLNKGLQQRLILISAPAGFGKTTLVSEWLSGCERPSAWLSLDEGDNDLAQFLRYLIASLQSIATNIGEEMLEILQTPQPPASESILAALLNEIAEIPDDFILVLDDYHMVDSRSIDNALTFLLEHMPPQMHLVITTREDPNLPLARFRVRDQITELRATDLRFTTAEAADFLKQVMSLDLSAEDITALEARTEGWVAGLQLAALSMLGHQDVSGFVQAFAGDHRYIVDYLVEEVLRRQPEPIRSFLLRTAILDRLNGSLCDAVTGQEQSKTLLETLQRGNFFLIPLDDKRDWYRYHHLFADVLRMHLMTEQPDQVPVLHRRASEWFEQHGSVADAIRHALAGEDFDRAANLIERALPMTRQSRQESTMLGWLQALPDELFKNRPVLTVHYAGTLLQNGQMDGVESRLQDAERWLNMPADLQERPIFVEEEEFQRLPASVAMYHAAIALTRADVANATKYARDVLALAREDDYFPRGAASSLLGLASWTGGDLDTGYRMFAAGMAYLQRVGFISDVIGGSVTLADIRITQGHLHEAISLYERGLLLATTPGGLTLRGAADMHVGMSDIYRERNELDTATRHLLKSKELGDLNGLPKNPYRWRAAMARVRQAQGDLDGALELLHEAEHVYMGDFSPNVRPIAALVARLWIAQGRLSEAFIWAREQGLSTADEVSYLREFEHITLARILLAQYRIDHKDDAIRDATGLLERLLKAAEEGGRMGSAVEILALQAIANQMRGDIPSALVALERALTLAEPEGYIRMFVDEGEPMRSLILEFRLSAQDHKLLEYVDTLLAAFPRPESKINNQKPKTLVEPLSQRELEVLRLFKTELSGPEIAQQLVIGLSTVRTHTKSIFSKLNVNNRRAAVQRAIDLGLI